MCKTDRQREAAVWHRVLDDLKGWDGREALEGGGTGIHVNKPLTHAFEGYDIVSVVFLSKI